jgi:hypothetical protein
MVAARSAGTRLDAPAPTAGKPLSVRSVRIGQAFCLSDFALNLSPAAVIVGAKCQTCPGAATLPTAVHELVAVAALAHMPAFVYTDARTSVWGPVFLVASACVYLFSPLLFFAG